jgi:DNA polymerase III subunit gamma/tau
MFTDVYRPIRFKDVVGQREVVTVLQAVAKNPQLAPRVYILYGERGLGKTSLARIFARSLSCQSFSGEPCLTCESCKGFSGLGSEYTATQVGNAEYMRQFKDSLMYTRQEGYRVITLDECHAASKESQGVLLKLFEDGPKNCFFLLCTTNLDKIRPEIISRALPLSFLPIVDEDMKNFLVRICEREGIEYSAKLLDQIVMVSSGHVRDAVMKLDLYRIMKDEEKFFSLIRVPEREIIEMFLAIKERDRARVEEQVRALLSYPLAYIRKGFDTFLLGLLRRYSGTSMPFLTPEYDRVLSLYGDMVLGFLPVFSSDWFYSCFKNDLSFQGLAWYLYATLSKQAEAVRRSPTESNPEGRFVKRGA